ncbi:hypothetical protein ACFL0D_09285 [Thermoproteota archaeon]
MGKATLITPAYLSVAWTLMITYQLFTETAVKTVMREIIVLWPQIGSWLNVRVDMLIFIYAFSWVFLLSSVIPSLILGKERGILVQFMVVLVLTISALIVQDVLVMYTEIEVDKIFSLAIFLKNPLDAASFLFFPYILMLLIDVCGRAKKHKRVAGDATLYTRA